MLARKGITVTIGKEGDRGYFSQVYGHNARTIMTAWMRVVMDSLDEELYGQLG